MSNSSRFNNIKMTQGSQLSRSSSSRLPMASFSKASEHLLEQGITTMVSLKGDGEFPPEVECMAAEFKGAIKGEINSVVSPMNIKLKNTEDTSKVKIGTLRSVVNALGGNKNLYYRIDRLKILYIPLFPQEAGQSGEITFSILDTSMIIGNRPKSVSKATVPLNKMSMTELSSTYFVPEKNINCIEFGYKAKRVPVVGRAFGFVCLAFYIHKDMIPATMKPKDPIVLLIDDVDVPIDINKTSSIKGLCDKVNKRIENKKKFMSEEKAKQDFEEGRRMGDMLIQDVSHLKENEIPDLSKFKIDNKFLSHTLIPRDLDLGVSLPPYSQTGGFDQGEPSECGGNLDPVQMTKEMISNYLPRNLPIYKLDEIIMDSGAPDHWFFNPNLVGLTDGISDNPVENINFYRVKNVEVKLGVYWVKLKEVLYAKASKIPLISFKKFTSNGIVDTMKAYDQNRAALCKEGTVVFDLDTNGDYMVFKPVKDSSSIMLAE